MQYDDDCGIHLLCAILLHALATGHAFTEGNKRTALLTILVAYNANNILLNYTHLMNEEYKEIVLWVVTSKPHVKEIAPRLESLANKYIAGLLEAMARRLTGGI